MLTKDQIEARRHGIGSSDAAAVLGVSKYRAPIDVWLEKLDRAAPFAGNERTRWGDLLEPVIAAEFAARTGLETARAERMLVHRKHAWMLCNPDRLIVGHDEGLEIKNRGLRQLHLYGTGPEDCSEEEICQSAHCMAVTGCSRWHVAVLLGGQELRIYTLQRDMELEELLIDAEANLWFNHVLQRIPPPPDGSESFRNYLASRYPRDKRPMRPAGAEEQELGESLAVVRQQLAEVKEEHERLANLLKNSMEDAGGIFWTGPEGQDRRITYKATSVNTRPFVPNF